MIDIKLIRDNPSLIKKNCKNRGYDEKAVSEILDTDAKWRKLKQEDDELRGERNKISENINQARKQKKDIKPLVKKAKETAVKINKNEQEEKVLKEKIDCLIASIPNIQEKDVPVGDASKNKEVSKWGKLPKIKNPKSHLELGETLDMIDIKRATKISGAGFYMLKGKLAILQRALIQFMLDFHNKNGFTEINPPQL